MAKSSKGAALVRTPEVVEPENPAVALVRNDANAIAQWASNALSFFKGANELEMAAKARLVRMEGLTVPTNGAQDAQVQDLIRLCNAGRKETTDYWYITGVFDKLHKWSVQGRKRAVDADEQAAQIGNRLHSTYTEAERRRAQAEEDRIRRERELKAQQDRQRELDQLEAAALKAEANSPTLSEREQNAVDLYVSGSPSVRNNMPACTRLSGYKEPDAMALKLLNMPKIIKAIEAAQSAIRMREQAEALKVAPVEVEDVVVRPDIQKGGDRTTYSADIFDVKAYVKAIASGQYGVNPEDGALDPNLPFANKLAQSLRENISRIPGVRLRKTTRVI